MTGDADANETDALETDTKFPSGKVLDPTSPVLLPCALSVLDWEVKPVFLAMPAEPTPLAILRLLLPPAHLRLPVHKGAVDNTPRFVQLPPDRFNTLGGKGGCCEPAPNDHAVVRPDDWSCIETAPVSSGLTELPWKGLSDIVNGPVLSFRSSRRGQRGGEADDTPATVKSELPRPE